MNEDWEYPRIRHPHPGSPIEFVTGHGVTEKTLQLTVAQAIALGSDLMKAAHREMAGGMVSRETKGKPDADIEAITAPVMCNEARKKRGASFLALACVRCGEGPCPYF